MSGFVFAKGTYASCPHGGRVEVTAPSPRVKTSGRPVATMNDPSPIVGCAATGTQSPCTQVRWAAPSVRVKVLGQPLLLQTSLGQCIGGAPAPATIVPSPARVRAT